MNAERKVPRELRPDGPLRARQGWVRLQEVFGLVLWWTFLVLVLVVLARRWSFLFGLAVLVLLFSVVAGPGLNRTNIIRRQTAVARCIKTQTLFVVVA